MKKWNLLQFRPTRASRLQFAPIRTDYSDELLRAIDEADGEQWHLEAMPDVESLDRFWSSVEEDLRQDSSSI